MAYIAIYAIRPLALFSSVLLTLAGGFLFGLVWGVIYTVSGANLSATVAFFVGRYFGQGVLDDESAGGLGAFNTAYSTVTLFARLRGWSTSAPRRTAIS